MNNFHLHKNEIGIDEAGRGSLLGRVYACAVIIGDISPIENIPKDIIINDSKKLSKNQRKKSYEWIINNVKSYSIGYAEPSEIDKVNILNATQLAMQRAISGIYDCKDEKIDIIIDGPRWENKFDKNKYNITSIIKGDSKYLSIAMASIIAKEEHDKHIEELCILCPELNQKYDLLNNMGYGTKKHLEGIKKNGISEYHRKLFSPCK